MLQAHELRAQGPGFLEVYLTSTCIDGGSASQAEPLQALCSDSSRPAPRKPHGWKGTSYRGLSPPFWRARIVTESWTAPLSGLLRLGLRSGLPEAATGQVIWLRCSVCRPVGFHVAGDWSEMPGDDPPPPADDEADAVMRVGQRCGALGEKV